MSPRSALLPPPPFSLKSKKKKKNCAPLFWNPGSATARPWAARGVLHAESILHSQMVRRTAAIESATFWSGVKSAIRCFSYKEIWKRSCPWSKLEINNLPRQSFISPPTPPSGFNGRPLSTLYVGALILERSFAEFGILHYHPPPLVYEGIFFNSIHHC